MLIFNMHTYYALYYFHPTITVYADDSESKPLNATFNETVILQCHPEGIKPRLIQWLKDEKSINFSVSSYGT